MTEKNWIVASPMHATHRCETEAEAIELAKAAIEDYRDGNKWRPGARRIYIAKITHQSTQTNRIERPSAAELDKTGCDKDGIYWGDYEYTCDYEMQPVADSTP